MMPVLRFELDHLVVGAQTLAEGCRFIGDLLGVSPVVGGVHHHMGTHNVLLSLGGSTYLEVIAIDPEGESPDRPRWFSLDNSDVQQVLEHGPQLLTWVARTPDISELKRFSPYAKCDVREMSRGNLRWLFAFTEDGECPGGGLLPHVIEWRGAAHPTDVLPDSNCRFSIFQAGLDDADHVAEMLVAMSLENLFTLPKSRHGDGGLSAVIETPHGEITL
ncbi:MAG TPA: VOC family protein [Gammaproteobacteria bacterium]|nr:VOC family protein [Gammaproteobacteria bacterium]